MIAVGQILKQRREAQGLSQRALAVRLNTSQAAISRIERGLVSPTFETVGRFLAALGEEPVLSVRRPELPADEKHFAELRRRTPAERFELAIGWNRLAGEMAAAGRKARGT
jgi:transcriptional regulator with XRE-family HTH domain